MRPPAVTVEQGVAVPLPDGTVLRADVWRPAAGERVPAILMRTPYLRHTHAFSAFLDPLDAAARGYATVIQDVRGRGDSEGAFEPFVGEAQDGADTIAWLAQQPWCNGRVVMAGHSYIGATQWLAATRAGDALAAIAPVVSSADQGEGWSLRNGVREHGFLATWVATGLASPDDLWLDDPTRAYREAPGLAEIAPWSAPWWDDATPASYWDARSAAPARAEISVPALQVGGWYDGFVTGTLRTYAAGAHPGDRLIVGPWGHDHWLPHIVGTHDLGWAGNAPLFGLAGRILDFYDAALAGHEPRLAPVTAYVLGARRWVELAAWPPPGAVESALPLAAGGSFVVDPADLPPALGGRGLRMTVPDPGFGPRDQRPLAARDDVLALPLRDSAGPLTLAGPVTARLAVGADGGVTRDWVVTLCVERADGELFNVCEGIARAPVEADVVEVSLGDVCVFVEKEERLVALVAGGATPRWPAPAVPGTQHVRADGSALSVTLAPADL
ncbi:CocE/NonD family hydrolase [Conexibacter woesei]|uniref:Peptidase S15 n=1 Tax=Conexibacter woesei (strain DSM 14684 / CCUG 47730 / CIP 108061 / JCM 11494 / NBRC 100937 / ID131577) TaxID=469383 RepID=D3FB10_CONWI|nr:CocE/NonD family hydrolase [Conexibacter woesei]ADB53202.1 peptidase S15 [Conexibacter woesei DSM 14684]